MLQQTLSKSFSLNNFKNWILILKRIVVFQKNDESLFKLNLNWTILQKSSVQLLHYL